MKNTKLFALAALAGGLTMGTAFADTWSGAYENTIVSTYDNGTVVNVYVEPDGSYTIEDAEGNELVKGTYEDTDEGSCFTPEDGGDPLCFEVKDYEVGDTFEGEDASGHFEAEIVEGRG